MHKKEVVLTGESRSWDVYVEDVRPPGRTHGWARVILRFYTWPVMPSLRTNLRSRVSVRFPSQVSHVYGLSRADA